jgi:hypothetical protein
VFVIDEDAILAVYLYNRPQMDGCGRLELGKARKDDSLAKTEFSGNLSLISGSGRADSSISQT